MTIVFGSEAAKQVLQADKVAIEAEREAAAIGNHKFVICRACDGSATCDECEGEGEDDDGEECWECGGTGECGHCDGYGELEMEFSNGQWWYVYQD